MFGKNKIIGVYEAGQDLSDPSVQPALHLPSSELIARVTTLGYVFAKGDIVKGRARLRADVIDSLLQSLTPAEPETAVEPQPVTPQPEHTKPAASVSSVEKQTQTRENGATPSQPPTAVEARENQVETIATPTPTRESLALSYGDLKAALSQLGLEEVLQDDWVTESNGRRVATIPREAFEMLAELQAAKTRQKQPETMATSDSVPLHTQPKKQPQQAPKPKPAAARQPVRQTPVRGANEPNLAGRAYDQATKTSRAVTPSPIERFFARKQQEEAEIIQKPKVQARTGLGSIETIFPDLVQTRRAPRVPREVGISVSLIVAAGLASVVLSSAAKELGDEHTGSAGSQVVSFVSGTINNLYDTVSAPANAAEQLVPFSSK